MMSLNLKEKIVLNVKDDLAAIEKELETNLSPWLDLTRDIAGHILFSGGKRLRPLIMILSARACGYSGGYETTFSVLFEYLHAATLLHDDLVDEADMRRGKVVANKQFGSAQAVLTGDFLLARSLSLAARTQNPAIIDIIAKVTEDMSQGEIHQLNNKGRLSLSEAEYMDVITRKTAVLIEGAAKSGALMAAADDAVVQGLAKYGLSLGIAFQMADDLLDYTSDAETLGKLPGADLKEGKLTLPVIYALAKATGTNGNSSKKNHKETMEAILKNPNFTETDFLTLKNYLELYEGISYTETMARHYVDEAKKALSVLPDSNEKEVLSMIADYALLRKS